MRPSQHINPAENACTDMQDIGFVAGASCGLAVTLQAASNSVTLAHNRQNVRLYLANFSGLCNAGLLSQYCVCNPVPPFRRLFILLDLIYPAIGCKIDSVASQEETQGGPPKPLKGKEGLSPMNFPFWSSDIPFRVLQVSSHCPLLCESHMRLSAGDCPARTLVTWFR